jgi:hypothetical protein
MSAVSARNSSLPVASSKLYVTIPRPFAVAKCGTARFRHPTKTSVRVFMGRAYGVHEKKTIFG